MKKKTLLPLILAAALLAVLFAVAYAVDTAETSMPYQGLLRDSSGSPLDITVSMTFAIYDDSTGGNMLWSENHPTVTIDSGYFSVRLGSINPIPDTAIAARDTTILGRWLQVTIGGEIIEPRTQLGAVPRAHFSQGVSGHIQTEPNLLRVSTVDGVTDDTSSVVLSSDSGKVQQLFVVNSGDWDSKADLSVDSTGPKLVFFVDSGEWDRQAELSADATNVKLNMVVDDGDWDCISEMTVNSTGPKLVFFVDTGDWERQAKLSVDSTKAGLFLGRNDTSFVSMVADDSGGLFVVWQQLPKGRSEPVVELSTQRGFVLTRDATDGYVLTSDAEGVGTWKPAPSCGPCWECPANYTYLGDINDSVGIGTEAPSEKLEVNGNTYIRGKATIGPGHTNSGDMGFAAGQGHLVTGNFSVAGGGSNHIASGPFSHVGGGAYNYADGYASNVSGGYLNAAMGNYSTVGGGQFDTVTGDYATVSGGERNTASNDYAAVGGGQLNVASGFISCVGGGWSNEATQHGATVAGGDNNTASGDRSACGGGLGNTASGARAVVAGGHDCQATNTASSVGGGYANLATGSSATISGGSGNAASGSFGSVGGGDQNSCGGDYSAIPGGKLNTIESYAHYSLAFGYGVCIDTAWTVIFYDSDSSGQVGINRDGCDDGIDYPLHIGTDVANGNGAYLSGAGVWTDGSKKSRGDIRELDGKEILGHIDRLPVESWGYEGTDERHIGPVAEDFVASFDVGVTRDDGERENHYLAASDVAGVALIGVQELYRMVQQQQQMAQTLQEKTDEIVQLKADMAKLQALVETILAQQSTPSGNNELASNR